MTYESMFISLDVAIKDKNTLNYAKENSILFFGTNVNLLRRWIKQVHLLNPETKTDIKNSIHEIVSLKNIEKRPPVVDISVGWSPYQSKEFLNSEGIFTGYYDKCFENEWQAISPYVDIIEGLDLDNDNYCLKNNIAYYITGNKIIVNQLKLVLNINHKNNEAHSLNKFIECVQVLFECAFKSKIDIKIIQAIKRRSNLDIYFFQSNISIRNHNFHNNNDGYSIVFTISRS